MPPLRTALLQSSGRPGCVETNTEVLDEAAERPAEAGAQTGHEGEFEFIGLSCPAGPDGTVRARAGRGEELITGDVAPGFLSASRAANPYLQDRVPGLYGSLVRGLRRSALPAQGVRTP